jgi:hypothetical protein
MITFRNELPQELESIKGKGRLLLLVVWNNQGIRTHEISNRYLPSNNLHTYSDKIKIKLKIAGWEVRKKEALDGRYKSWRWFLEPIKKASE